MDSSGQSFIEEIMVALDVCYIFKIMKKVMLWILNNYIQEWNQHLFS